LKTYQYNIDHPEHITHTSLNATTFVAAYGKCGSDYILWEDKGDTCVRVCEMSVKYVYVVRTTHYHKYFPLKRNKPPFACQAITPMPKDDTFYVKIKA